jgi:ribosomal protein RSM22 (predicted rRNA methylase)
MLNALQQAVENLLKDIDLESLKHSSQSLSHHYQQGGSLRGKEELLAYLVVRLPATYAVLRHVLSQLPSQGSLLDLGAGPGTVWWAAQGAHSVTAVEREPLFIELGKKLGSQADWIKGDFHLLHFDAHDWVIFGYSLGEVAKEKLFSLVNAAWQAARKGVVIVEPGTPRGYQRVLAARDYLISQGGFCMAPCPHAGICPLKSPDWCHFSVRLERTFLHRAAKLASLPFEDEKFSYAILTKQRPTPQAVARIIGPPKRHSGHVVLPLCTKAGVQMLTFCRSQKELYKKARKSHWGDSWDSCLDHTSNFLE